MTGENLDLSSDPEPQRRLGDHPEKRPFLGVTFACCAVYARIYVNRSATAYEGHCPRCGRPIRIDIGPGGSSDRFFDAF
jgi:hypothetical protein